MADESKHFFKYFSDSPQVIDSVFKFKKIRFTQPWALNDPLEFNPAILFNHQPANKYSLFELNGIVMPSVEQFFRANLLESQINVFGILSLTDIKNSFEMWSHYSNGHKGFLMELKPDFTKHECMKSWEGKEYPIVKVVYTRDYSFNVDEIATNGEEILLDDVRDKMLYTKISRWSHENEYRVVRWLRDCAYYKIVDERVGLERDENIYLFDFPLECVKSIYFGAYMSPSNKELILTCCKNHVIDFYQAYIIRDWPDDHDGHNGQIQFIPIDHWKSTTSFFSLQSAHFCVSVRPNLARTSEGQENEPMKVGSLKDIPYYSGNEQLVGRWYESLKKFWSHPE